MNTWSIPQALALAGEHLDDGRPADAEQICRAVLAVAPAEHLAYRHLGIAAYYCGNLAAAEQFLRHAVALQPGVANYYDNLSVILFAQSKLDEAESAARTAIGLEPKSSSAYINLGNALQLRSRLQEAMDAYRAAINIEPHASEAHNNLGVILHSLGRFRESEFELNTALRLNPNYEDAQCNLCATMIGLGKFPEAEGTLREQLLRNPGNIKALNNLAAAFHAQCRYADAVAASRESLRIHSRSNKAWGNLGLSLASLGQLTEAEAAYRRSLELLPGQFSVLSNLGLALQGQGRLPEAIDCFENAVDAQPDDSSAFSHLLCCMQYRPGVSSANLLQLHQEWDRRYGGGFPGPDPFAVDSRGDRPLRLGFLSMDLGMHPVGYFLAGCLDQLDRKQFQVVGYVDRANPDAMTERIRQSTREWTSVVGMTSEEVSRRIRGDQIDILFDLAGHTSSRRLKVFSLRSAPIQISWIGYVGTTGIATMDYLLADRYHVPPGSEADYRERILRLPNGYVCFDPPIEAPEVGRPPLLSNGFPTFGCFNNSVKIHRGSIACWAEILRRAPTARLVLKCIWFADMAVRERYAAMFQAEGIDTGRIKFEGSSPRPQLLETYNHIDVALDTFPYSGGLTTCEALWMGVPVITCPGQTFASRHSLSHLTNAGFPELVASSMREYVELAVTLANDVPRLTDYRQRLRRHLLSSPLCDTAQFADDFGQSLRHAWRKFLSDGKES